MYDGALTGLEDKEKIRRRSLSIDVSFILDLKIGLWWILWVWHWRSVRSSILGLWTVTYLPWRGMEEGGHCLVVREGSTCVVSSMTTWIRVCTTVATVSLTSSLSRVIRPWESVNREAVPCPCIRQPRRYFRYYFGKCSMHHISSYVMSCTPGWC